MRAVLAVLLAALCFATTGTAQELADVGASPLAVGLARVLLGGALLAGWWRLGPRSTTTGPPSGAGEEPTRGALARVPTTALVGVGALGVLAYQPTFFAGTADNGVAVGTVVALGSAPVVTGLGDALLRRRVPGSQWLLATALALVGVALVGGAGGALGSGGDVAGAGVLWSVGAGASYAVYALTGKELLDRGWASGATMGAMFGLAAVVALPLLLATGPTWLLGRDGLLLVLWLGVVTTTVAYLLFGWGLARLPATTVATLTLAEPLCATLLGVGVLGERLGVATGLGLLVLAAGLAVLTGRGREGQGAPERPLTPTTGSRT
ncbi:drug/metabolite transporter, DME family [Nocardioides scoriae]|uniref:Drug/metabolite transporter, DME family n=1 Tax=Nocardioides scoriae TaxID=642780 RepID=A0A1H1NPA3_9ACTN|nr:EamA family transporter [Nocardioides scoriae]SDS00768.1 drug/metabolite transporter, DME family [Nocardioides scoriae]